MSSKQFKAMMARKMSGHRIRTGSKALSHELFRARVNKKRMPEVPIPRRDGGDYRRMSISEWENKYL